MKKCTTCKKKLPNSKFCKDRSRKDGLSYRCKECSNAHTKRDYIKNYSKRLKTHRQYDRTHRLESKFGLSPEAWDAYYQKQNGCCAICGKHQSQEGKRLAVDHNHFTGNVRGLLCMSCNTKLGWFENNLCQVIDYLKEDI